MEKVYKDELGRARECHFCKNQRGRVVCVILEDFYNAEDGTDLCGKCPFYKTDEEFWKGWNRRGSYVSGTTEEAV